MKPTDLVETPRLRDDVPEFAPGDTLKVHVRVVEGTREGLDAARARGRTGGRKPKLNAPQSATVRRMYEAVGPDGKRQHTVAEIAEAVGMHRTTVYDYLKKEG